MHVMQEAVIDAALDKVVVEFEAGRIRPLILEWSGRCWPVERVNSRWRERFSPRRIGFSLTMRSGDVFRVSYVEERLMWRIDSVFGLCLSECLSECLSV